MAEHGVARMTARAALASLRDEGLTTTRRGVGVFVRTARPIVRNAIGGAKFRQLSAGRAAHDTGDYAQDLGQKVLEARKGEVPSRGAAGLLSLDPGDTVTVRSRLYFRDDRPAMLVTSYLPDRVTSATRLAQVDFDRSIYAELIMSGYGPAQFREDLTAAMPTPDEVSTLQMEPGTLVIRITRTSRYDKGTSVEVAYLTLDAAKFTARYDFSA
ncbi:GntR family transcriptional regulator [Austwickia chelonae]|uniref:Putative GntR family transcriptional regulator n=1 Tax=Austwickia chelonae NBRC 105200 TaxID=1184607 RepID=K6VJY1_9MICO|nr:GntR family transcriptional regulator [Austwickia chelonae]GAB76999.1 putative GntR family transcriptional regulator [Austwickia chelonae NBRC 105200]SEW33174.1 GntR family transcriptional regulator [Austwickia chelonae]